MKRAEIIKNHYLKCKNRNGDCIFSDLYQFECGSQIAYEMEEDFEAMKYALKELKEYEKTHPVEYGRDIPLRNAMKALERRINEYNL